MCQISMDHAEVVTAFYEAFRRKDFKTMQLLYGDNATFSDPVFKDLNAAQVRAMWEMLIGRGKEMTVDYVIGVTTGNEVQARWTASYLFSATGRKVVNHINARLTVVNGRITQHIDDFNFPKWAKQALGWKGLFFGHTSFLQNKVRATAQEGLAKFMSAKGQG